MLGSLMTSTKQITQENQVIFPNDKQSSVTTNEIFTTDEFHIHLKTLLPYNLQLNMNISLPYHTDDLKSLIINWQVKAKIIGISECRLKENIFFQTLIQEVLSLNTQIQNLQKVEPLSKKYNLHLLKLQKQNQKRLLTASTNILRYVSVDLRTILLIHCQKTQQQKRKK